MSINYSSSTGLEKSVDLKPLMDEWTEEKENFGLTLLARFLHHEGTTLAGSLTFKSLSSLRDDKELAKLPQMLLSVKNA